MTPPAVRLPARPAAGHKGTFGHVLAVAGSRGMTGAAILCGSAAVRGGAGLVTVACPADVQAVVAAGNPCYLTHGLPTESAGEYHPEAESVLAGLAAKADAVAVGPGLGSRPDVVRLVQSLLAAVGPKKVVVDADALTAVGAGRRAGQGDWVLTPHPGEFGRLLGVSAAAVQADRERLAVKYAAAHNVVVLLKGQGTVVTDGKRTSVNPTGNPGMGTGGVGDVLTGVIAALLAQGLSGFDAAVLGAWVHGRAGDLAADELSQTALTATDVLGYLPRAFREVEAAGP